MPAAQPTTRAAALAVLGLPATATEAQIVGAYRRLVRATHPDATGRTDPAAAREFAAVHAAYRLLADQPRQSPAEPPPAPDEPAGRGVAPRRTTARAANLGFGPPRARPPIVAGPVVVIPLPPRDRPHRRRSR